MNHHIVGRVHFRSAERGGRSGPTTEAYFGCIFNMDNENNDCRLVLGDGIRAKPGQSMDVRILFIRPDYLEGRLEVGKHFSLCEGRKIIADGEIISLNLNNIE
jgi:hypothetical protein